MARTHNLHLNVHKEWFDMIASGEKKIEYRKDNEYWRKRLWAGYMPMLKDNPVMNGEIKIGKEWIPAPNVTLIISNGYGTHRRSMVIKCKGINRAKPNPKWTDCHDPEEYLFNIHLDDVIHVHTKQNMY